MNFEIQTSSYFDAEAKRLAKRHRSFIDDLQDFQKCILANPFQGTDRQASEKSVLLSTQKAEVSQVVHVLSHLPIL